MAYGLFNSHVISKSAGKQYYRLS